MNAHIEASKVYSVEQKKLFAERPWMVREALPAGVAPAPPLGIESLTDGLLLLALVFLVAVGSFVQTYALLQLLN